MSDQGILFPPNKPAHALSPEEAAIAAEALSYALAMRSRGCALAPQWGDGVVVGCVGPLLGRLRC